MNAPIQPRPTPAPTSERMTPAGEARAALWRERTALHGLVRGRAISTASVARRRRLVALAKRVLPLAALALLGAIVLWPELSRDLDRRRVSLRETGVAAQSGQMVDATYHSVDARGRPYTVTATGAREIRTGIIDLAEPQADMTQATGGWLMARSRHGVYDQHAGNLDVWGDVQMYRDDGTTLVTSSANLDLRAGAAAGAEAVHVEGPFGTLDAQGFTATDRGAVTHFAGPGRLVLNARR